MCVCVCVRFFSMGERVSRGGGVLGLLRCCGLWVGGVGVARKRRPRGARTRDCAPAPPAADTDRFDSTVYVRGTPFP